MISVTLGVVALLAVVLIIALAPRSCRSAVVGGLAGMFVGFLFGVMADVAIGVMHWFGGIDIADPVIHVVNVATTCGTLYPVIFGLVGFVFGVARGRMRTK